MIAIVDCNNFYCSCERVFNPQLRDKPVVVLSNNDGCVVARSNEVKAMGIKMGTPLYQIREVLEANNVAVFSSNYNLYGDMSRRVMMLLSEFTPELTQYSIDEAFLIIICSLPSSINHLLKFSFTHFDFP
jgi:DNA polymerase V